MWKEKFIQYLRYEKNYSPQTEIAYLKDIAQFSQFIAPGQAEFDPTTVDGELIRVWISSLMEQEMKPGSVNRKLSALKSFFKYLKKKKIITNNPAESISRPKNSKRLPTFVSDKEMSKVIDDPDNFTDDFRGWRDRLIIELLYLTGMRRAELIALKNSDINFSNCTLRVTGKRDKQRLIPFSDKTKNKIEHYIEMRDASVENKSHFLFVKEDGAPLYPKLVYNIINNHLNSISTLSKKSPHVIRHSFATAMLNSGAEINAVKELLGHSSLASTEIYTHVTFEEMKKIYDKAHPRAKK